MDADAPQRRSRRRKRVDCDQSPSGSEGPLLGAGPRLPLDRAGLLCGSVIRASGSLSPPSQAAWNRCTHLCPVLRLMPYMRLNPATPRRLPASQSLMHLLRSSTGPAAQTTVSPAWRTTPKRSADSPSNPSVSETARFRRAATREPPKDPGRALPSHRPGGSPDLRSIPRQVPVPPCVVPSSLGARLWRGS